MDVARAIYKNAYDMVGTATIEVVPVANSCWTSSSLASYILFLLEGVLVDVSNITFDRSDVIWLDSLGQDGP